jgi:hypothetical protein
MSSVIFRAGNFGQNAGNEREVIRLKKVVL